MVVTQPRDASELVGLLKCGLEHDGPFATRYPRDTAPGPTVATDDVEPIPLGTWERLREGSGCAILAVGPLCDAALAAADALAEHGHDVAVVNCRFLKPLDEDMLRSLVDACRVLVTVEDGTVVNGFGAYLASKVEAMDEAVRVVPLGVPDRTWEHASRARQLKEAGLDPEGIAAAVVAAVGEESLSAR